MKENILFFLFFLFAVPALIHAKDFVTPKFAEDSLLSILDKTIEEKQIYTDLKENRIDSLKKQAHKADSKQTCFSIYAQLFEEYKNFQMDSALVIANRRMDIANRLDSDTYRFFAQMNIAEVMVVTGMYKEALDILNNQDRSQLETKDQFASLYHLYHSLYMVMAQYSFIEKEKEKYLALEYQYKDSLLSILPPDNIGYQLVKVSQLNMDKKYGEAHQLATEIYRINKNNRHLVGMLMHHVTDTYSGEGKFDEAEFFLTLSAINDIKSGVKEYMSLPELASILYKEGDINRAYNYMKCSLEDAIFCQARLRTLQMSKTIPIITAAYQTKMKQEHDRLVAVIIAVVILAIGLTVAVIYIYKKLKELAQARKSLKTINQELQSVNSDLNKLNIELSESNHIKEEYIGYVFSICSIYIDKLDAFRKRINRKIKGGQIEDLLQQTESSSFVNDELKEFYKSFDSVFLNLYPNFVKDFNSLMQEGKQIMPKEGELLTPEMRIYALVRLGINDSVKIASFLHYSTQTVYNYRQKARNKARMPKDDFYGEIKKSGRSSI